MDWMVLTGRSGAGLTTALGALEDLGYRTMHGMLPALLPEAMRSCGERAAAAVTIHSGDEAAALQQALEHLRAEQGCRLIYLEAEEETLVNRYKFTRRPHPLIHGGKTTLQSIREQKEFLLPLRAEADVTIDTTRLTARQLRETMQRVATGEEKRALAVSVESFGFKYGIPKDADLVMDVRFLPNPYYLPELREKDGTNPAVRDYVFRDGTADELMERLVNLIDFLIPQYRREGKAVLTIAVGCTGGRHRSVAIAQALTEYLQEKEIRADAVHRDRVRG